MLKPEVIDAVGVTKSGGLDLMIDDTVGWDDPADHLVRLQAKLNSYLAFVESGEAQAKFPGAADRLVRIVIVADAPFPPDGQRFLEAARSIVGDAGINLRFRLAWARTPGAGTWFELPVSKGVARGLVVGRRGKTLRALLFHDARRRTRSVRALDRMKAADAVLAVKCGASALDAGRWRPIGRTQAFAAERWPERAVPRGGRRLDTRLDPDAVEALLEAKLARRRGGRARDVLVQFRHPDGREVMLSDDGRTGYAYLSNESQMLAHAWLYNVASAPRDRFVVREHQPLNPAWLCRRGVYVPRLGGATEPFVVWGATVDVYLDDELVARFDDEPGGPGMSRLAAKDGPLARVLR